MIILCCYDRVRNHTYESNELGVLGEHEKSITALETVQGSHQQPPKDAAQSASEVTDPRTEVTGGYTASEATELDDTIE